MQRSTAKVACLPIIVGGAAFASLKQGGDGAYKLKFDTTALRTYSLRSRSGRMGGCWRTEHWRRRGALHFVELVLAQWELCIGGASL